LDAHILGETALADPGLACEQEQAPLARDRLLESGDECPELRLAPDERARRRGDPGGWHEVEFGVVHEDRLFEPLERRARFDPELVDERAARRLVGLERFRLTTRAVEREHHMAAKALAQRMQRDQLFELADELGMAALREVGFDALFERRESEFFEARDLGLGERLVRELRQRRPAPERERLLVPPLANEPFEAVHVDLVWVDAQDVAGRLRGEHPVREHLAQPRDVHLHARDGGLGRALAPEFIDEAVARNDLVRVQEEHGEECALFRAAERHGAAGLSNFEWPEQPQFNV
jgi:hypothetical protein